MVVFERGHNAVLATHGGLLWRLGALSGRRRAFPGPQVRRQGPPPGLAGQRDADVMRVTGTRAVRGSSSVREVRSEEEPMTITTPPPGGSPVPDGRDASCLADSLSVPGARP